MFRSNAAFVFTTVMFSLATPAFAENFKVEIDKTFTQNTMTWNSQRGELHLTHKFINKDGKLALCGAYAHSNGRVAMANLDALKSGYVKVNGKRVLRSFRYFTSLGVTEDLSAGVANCKTTRADAKGADIAFGIDKGSSRH